MGQPISYLSRGLIAALFVLSLIVSMQPARAFEQLAYDQHRGPVIKITVDQVRNSDGWIRIELYDGKADAFLSDAGRVKEVQVAAEAGATSVSFRAPATGVYAVVLYHDENANDDLDQNFIGYPMEGYGFSNNPKLFLAPPSHEETAFEVVGSGAQLAIKVTYP